MQEVELSQRHIIKRFLAESVKGDKADPGVLVKLAASMRENARSLSEMGFVPPIILSRLQGLIPKNVKEIQNDNDNDNNITATEHHVKSDIYLSFN